MVINATFQDTEQLVDAIQLLRQKGTTAEHMEIFSNKPIELKPGVLDRPSKMALISVITALFSGILVTSFIFYTQLDYPLITGGMPLTSSWGTGVVTFKLTMAGAILGTVFMFLWESGLFQKRRYPAPDLPESGMVLQVEYTDDTNIPIDLLKSCGATSVDTLDKL